VVLEATYGWYWAVDALRDLGAQVHLAHPLGVKAFEYRRVKNDLLTELPARVPGVPRPAAEVLASTTVAFRFGLGGVSAEVGKRSGLTLRR
jgi:transposase